MNHTKTSKHLRSILVVLSFITIQGCLSTSKKVTITYPTPPKSQYETAQEVVNRNILKESSQWMSSSDLKGKVIGIDTFTGNDNGSPLATQTVTRQLLNITKALGEKNSVKVVDRSTLRKRKDEIELNDKNFSSYERSKQLQMIGKAISADYLLDGSVTEYTNSQQMIILKRRLLPGEKKRYTKEYETYQNQVKQEIERLQNLPIAEKVLLGGIEIIEKAARDYQVKATKTLSIEQYEEKLREKNLTESVGVASIGITARLINVSTGEFVWLYQDEHRGRSLMTGMQEVTERMVIKMLENTVDEKQIAIIGGSN